VLFFHRDVSKWNVKRIIARDSRIYYIYRVRFRFYVCERRLQNDRYRANRVQLNWTGKFSGLFRESRYPSRTGCSPPSPPRIRSSFRSFGKPKPRFRTSRKSRKTPLSANQMGNSNCLRTLWCKINPSVETRSRYLFAWRVASTVGGSCHSFRHSCRLVILLHVIPSILFFPSFHCRSTIDYSFIVRVVSSIDVHSFSCHSLQ